MLYDFECQICETHFERILPVSECDYPQECPSCGHVARKIIVLGHGGIWRKSDGAPWVRDAAKVLTDGDSPSTMETVDDYRNYLAAHPEIRPKEDHPCIPSSYGDCFDSQPDPVQIAKDRSRKGHEKLRELQSITVNSGQA